MTNVDRSLPIKRNPGDLHAYRQLATERVNHHHSDGKRGIPGSTRRTSENLDRCPPKSPDKTNLIRAGGSEDAKTDITSTDGGQHQHLLPAEYSRDYSTGPFQFRSEDGTDTRLSPSPLSHHPRSSKSYASTVSQLPSTRASTVSGGNGTRAERGQLTAVRAGLTRAEAEARQVLTRAEPNLFPEIIAKEEDVGERERGVVGWRGDSFGTRRQLL